MKFSQRKGYVPVKTQIQIEGIDLDLKNGLWNCLVGYFNKLSGNAKDALAGEIWKTFFKKRIDEAPNEYYLEDKLSDWFYEEQRQWYEIYDLVEFISDTKISYDYVRADFVASVNTTLELESSGYRCIGGQIIQITDEIELNEIESALKSSEEKKFKGVKIHLSDALSKLSDRKKPDYRNSIKESISAVESLAKDLSGKPNASLKDALVSLELKLPVHGALRSGLLSIYGYTSDSNGIRHALLDESQLDFDDAKFMLVSCSAFVNYLIAKASKTGMYT